VFSVVRVAGSVCCLICKPLFVFLYVFIFIIAKTSSDSWLQTTSLICSNFSNSEVSICC
jgi:hypothetical protein